jgi:hypothetical protein
MTLKDELIERLARRRAEQLGSISASAFDELLADVRRRPDTYLEHPADQAFSLLVRGVERVMRSREDDELRDDEGFYQERSRRMARLARDCAEALAVCPESSHARLLAILAADLAPDAQYDALLELDRDLAQRPHHTEHAGEPSATGDAWSDLARHGELRVQAALARTALDTARYRQAIAHAKRLLTASPTDVLGARHTAALCYARLEDEAGFDALDASYGRRGSTWQQLARTILFYKLDRLPAARRSLAGFARLCEGGPYALLRPIMADTYLPDRPSAPAYSFEEATLAVHEADPIICDVPDFCVWAESQEGFAHAAESYARKHGFLW